MSAQEEIKRLTAPDIRARKGGEPIVSLTSYHAHTARLVTLGELASGIAADDRVITAPPDGLSDGDAVRVVGAKGKPATASEKQPPKG